MKFLIALTLLIALAASQDSASNRRAPPQSPTLPSSRVQLQGKLGESESKLDTNFQGWSTYLVTPDNLELSHCAARILDQDDSNKDADLRNKKNQQSGKIFHTYAFYDKNAGTVRTFHLLQQDESDLGTCWSFEGDQNSAVIEDWQTADQKCGARQEGTILTRKSTFTDAKGQQIVGVEAICMAKKKASLISAEYSINGKPVAVMEANVVQVLEEPDINDRATLLELSVPPACFTGNVRPFDIGDLMDALNGQNDSDSDSDKGRLANRE